MSNNKVLFGSIDIKTGETKTGYIDKNGEMKYKKLPWYKRIFNKKTKLEKTEYIGILDGERWFYIGTQRCSEKTSVAAYKRFNPFTNETYEIFATQGDEKFLFDVNAYEKNGKLIKL